MKDSDQPVIFSMVTNGDLPETPWAYDRIADDSDDRVAVDPRVTFTSMRFIAAALKRSTLLWCVIALGGLLIGCGVYVKFPPAYQASTSVLIMDGPNVDAAVAVQTDAALADSDEVAQLAMNRLGLRQSVSSFIATYTATVVTNQVILITVNAPSGGDALSRAAALAAAFLQFHMDYVNMQEQQLIDGLNQQVSQAQQQLNSIDSQINELSAEPSSPGLQSKIKKLQAQRQDSSNTLSEIKAYVVGTVANTRAGTSSALKDSVVIDSATLKAHSHLKTMLRYGVVGLIAGLAVGMGFVIVSALASNRLRRRDDIAEALDTPVRLSVGALHGRRWLPDLPWRAAKKDRDMRRVIAHLYAALPGSSRGPASLAIAAVDNAPVVAPAVVRLAISHSSQHRKVVVADLSDGAHIARLLGLREPGVHTVSQDGIQFLVVLPDPDDVAPVGPLHGITSMAVSAQVSKELAAACTSVDVLLTLANFDPAFGSDYLSTWATDVVAVITAGRSSAERISGVGEMIRLAGTRLESAVLIGADRNDESLGATPTQNEPTLG